MSVKHQLDVASACDFTPVAHTHDLAHSTALRFGTLLLNVCLWPVVPSRASACPHLLMRECLSFYSTLLPDVTLGLRAKWSNTAFYPPPFAKVVAVRGWSIDTACLVNGSPFSLFYFMLGTVVCTWHISMLSRCFITAGREGLFHQYALSVWRKNPSLNPASQRSRRTNFYIMKPCVSHIWPSPCLWCE